MKKILSCGLGFLLGLLIVAPAFEYKIPLMINSFFWCYLVIVAAFLGIFLKNFDIHPFLKILPFYLFANCFISQAPYASFNAYLLVIVTFYFFVAVKECDFQVILKFIESAFWLQLILAGMQIIGKDTLINFNKPTPVIMGTVMQYMRFASVLAVMTPFLILKSRWYSIPILIMCILSQSSTFALSLIAGLGTYLVLKGENKIRIFLPLTLALICYAAYDWGSFRGAIIPSNGGRIISWINIFQTWFMDTSKDITFPMLEGPFKWTWALFGHGMDTFLPLFPIYKHDPSPFPQAHNSWLQFGWEIGLFGLGLIVFYMVSLTKRLIKAREFGLCSGVSCIATNMFFAFPDRMTQSALLIVYFVALCEKKLKKLEI